MYGLELNYQALQCEVMGEPCVKVGEIQPYARLEVWFSNDLNVDKIVLWRVDGKGNAHLDKITVDIVEHLKTKVCV